MARPPSKSCKEGHPLSGANVLLGKRTDLPSGVARICRTCRKKWYESRRERRAELDGVGLPPDTPAVRAGYKEPLTPIKDGFGYYGTIAYNSEKTHTQCHVCGWFYTNVGLHVRRRHGVDPRQYRTKFGLNLGTSLLAPEGRAKYTAAFAGRSDSEKREILTKLTGSRAGSRNKTWQKSLYRKNLEGRCPDQLVDKAQALAKKLGHTPKSDEFRREYGGFLGSVYLTFGSWSKLVRIAELTPLPKGQKRQRYSHDSLLEILRNFEAAHGREPTSADIRGLLLPSFYTFSKFFDSWTKAKSFAFAKQQPTGVVVSSNAIAANGKT